MPTAPRPSRREIEAKLIVRAWKDPKFAEALRRDPRAAVERELSAMAPGATLPRGMTVNVIEETAGTRYVVVPRKPDGAEDLPDAELARIAGAGPGSSVPYDPYDSGSADMRTPPPPGPGNSVPYDNDLAE